MNTNEALPVAEQPGKEVLINVVLDRSGSMESCREATISGYNEYLKGLAADKETKYSVSLLQFDSPNNTPELTVSYVDKPLAEVPVLDLDGYVPRGMTPLYDAVGECCRRVDAKGRAVITVIITDGEENASHEFTRESVKQLIAAKEKEGWGFVFLGANIDAKAVGGVMGMANQSYNYTASARGTQALYSNVAKSTSLRSANVRSFGMTVAASMDFMTKEQEEELLDPALGLVSVPPIPPVPQPVSKRRDWKVKLPRIINRVRK